MLLDVTCTETHWRVADKLMGLIEMDQLPLRLGRESKNSTVVMDK